MDIWIALHKFAAPNATSDVRARFVEHRFPATS
jgi:hypothetical protein